MLEVLQKVATRLHCLLELSLVSAIICGLHVSLRHYKEAVP